MGTRALISINGKPFIATHWDGYPKSLGCDLAKIKTKDQKGIIEMIIQIANQHTIDFADKKVIKIIKPNRIAYLAKKHNLTPQQIKQGMRTGAMFGAEDFLPDDIKQYGDFAEYQYDYNTKTKRFIWRDLGAGAWPDSVKTADPYKKLTKQVCRLNP